MTAFTLALLGVFLLPDFSAAAPALTKALDTAPAYTVAMTGYNAVPGQTDDSPDITASGAYSNPEIVAARSVDLADELPFGTVIEIDPTTSTSSPTCGLGIVQDKVGFRVIADSMHPRMHDKIDILFDGGSEKNPARTLGVCKDVTIRVVGKVDINHMPKNQTELKRAVAQQLAIKKF